MENQAGVPRPSLLETEMYRAVVAGTSLYPGSDMPYPDEEAERQQQEAALTADEIEEKAFFCLHLAFQRMEADRDVFTHVSQVKSPESGMREDDVLVSLLHSAWATCYNRLLSLPATSLSSLSPEETETLVSPPIPGARFSQQTLRQIDEAIERLAVSRILTSVLSTRKHE